LYEMAKSNPSWFCEVLTVDDTHAITLEAINEERLSGMDEDLIQQEFYCSFNAAIQGSYYSKQLSLLEEMNRVTEVAYESNVPVHTFWDLGIGDAMSIWFVQFVGREVHIIDFYEAEGEGFPYYVKVLQEKGYIYGTHNAPHDIAVKELGTGVSRLETAEKLGIKFKIVKNISIDDGINAVRTLLPRCWFDKEKTKQGWNALVNYHKEYDENRKQYKNTPYHDWSSHAADAFRYLAVGVGEQTFTSGFKVLTPNTYDDLNSVF
jgi:phage terminase large subunit